MSCDTITLSEYTFCSDAGMDKVVMIMHCAVHHGDTLIHEVITGLATEL